MYAMMDYDDFRDLNKMLSTFILLFSHNMNRDDDIHEELLEELTNIKNFINEKMLLVTEE